MRYISLENKNAVIVHNCNIAVFFFFQLSYAETHPMFTALKHPNFFRMTPSEKEFNMPRLHLLQRFNWTRIGTLFQNEPRHALVSRKHYWNCDFTWDVSQSLLEWLKSQTKTEKLIERARGIRFLYPYLCLIRDFILGSMKNRETKYFRADFWAT